MQAANYFTEKFSNPLAESTVRNFVRALQVDLTQELKDEVLQSLNLKNIHNILKAFMLLYRDL